MKVDDNQVEPKFEVTPEAISAAGQSCIALSTAIASLVTNDAMTEEVRELTEQLRLTSRALRWLIREGRQPDVYPGFTKIDTKGIELNTNSPVCQFMVGVLEKGKRKAMDVIGKAVVAGHNKNEVFAAKEVLKIKTEERFGKKWWCLPDQE